MKLHVYHLYNIQEVRKIIIIEGINHHCLLPDIASSERLPKTKNINSYDNKKGTIFLLFLH